MVNKKRDFSSQTAECDDSARTVNDEFAHTLTLFTLDSNLLILMILFASVFGGRGENISTMQRTIKWFLIHSLSGRRR